jgi:hypothetical protein
MHLALKRPKNLLTVVVVVALVLLVVINIPGTIRYTQLRKEIDWRYSSAIWAKEVVLGRAMAGDLASLATLNSAAGENVSFSAKSGIVTLIFSGFPNAPDQTLNLVPLVEFDGVTYELAAFVDSKRPLVPLMVRWICLPAVSSTRDQYLLQNRGTLSIDLAPAECR